MTADPCHQEDNRSLMKSLCLATLCLAGLSKLVFAAFDSSISVNGSGAVTQAGIGLAFTASGTANLGGFGTATFSASGQGELGQSGSFTGPINGTFKLDFSGGNTLSGTFAVPAGILAPQAADQGASASGSLTVTAGTGAFAGTSGSFPNVTGTGTSTGTFSSTFQFSGAGSLNLGPTTAPPPSIASVLNTYSGDTHLSPGCLATVSGKNLSGQSAAVQVGGKPAALLSASPASLAIQIPVEAPVGPAVVSELRDGFNSSGFNITLDSVAPAILSSAGALGSFFHLNGTAIAADSPATPGETIRLAAACLGPTNPQVATGSKTPASPPVVTVLAPTLSVGGKSATVSSSVSEPGLVGVYSVYFAVPLGLDAKNQAVVLSVSGKGSNTVQLPVGPAFPVVSAIVNGASFGNLATVAPGEFVTVFGANFGNQDKLDGFPGTNFGGVSVSFGATAAPLFSLIASAGQINLVTPSELPETGTIAVVARNQLGNSQTYNVNMVSASPGIFILADPANADRRNAAALFANTAWRVIPESMAAALSLPSSCRTSGISAAAICGESATAGDSIEIFITGLGKATPGGDPNGATLATGVIAPADGSVLYLTVQKPAVTIGGVQVDVPFSGIAPGSAGLYQVNVTIPATAPKGDAVPVVITMPGGAKDTATIPIR